MKDQLKLVGTVVGSSCVWSYMQKGFFVSSLVGFPQVDETLPVIVLLASLSVSLVVFLMFRNAVESGYSKHRHLMVAFTVLLVTTELTSYMNLASLGNQEFSTACCVVYYLVQGVGIISLFFAWVVHLLHIAYDQKLSVVVIILFAILTLSRLITTAIYGPGELLTAEMTFMLGISACLWLACYDFNRTCTPVCNATLADSPSATSYFPVLICFIVLDVSSRALQMFDTGSTWMLDLNPSREIVLLVALALCLAAAALPPEKCIGLKNKELFFLIVGITIGLTVGQLFGLFTGASTPALFFNFTETIRALLRATLLFIIFFLVYETSLSAVTMFGVFLVLPIILNRLSYVVPKIVPNLPVFSTESQVALLVVIAVCFLMVMAAMLKTFLKSNTFLMLVGGAPKNDAEYRSGHDGVIQRLAATYALTERESEIFGYLSNGYSAKRISDKLYISPYTVQNHTKCIYRKLGIHSKQELIDIAEAWRAPT